MDALIFSLGAPVTKAITGINTFKQKGLFLLILTVYTLLFILYKCKVKTASKPNVNFSKLIYAMIPMLIYVVVITVLLYISSFSYNPMIIAAYSISTTTFCVWLIALLAHYPAVRLSHPDCFPSIFSSIWKKIKSFF